MKASDSRHLYARPLTRHNCRHQDFDKGDQSYAEGVARLAGSTKTSLVESHLALLQANVQRAAVAANLQAAESCVRWDALRCSAGPFCSEMPSPTYGWHSCGETLQGILHKKRLRVKAAFLPAPSRAWWRLSVKRRLCREVLLRRSGSAEAFLAMRQTYQASLSAVAATGYIAGSGDRHMENYLLSSATGALVPIDWGCEDSRDGRTRQVVRMSSSH